MSEFPEYCLGPMAGITDAAMRSVCLRFGAPICYTEMISAKALIYHNKNTEDLLVRAPNEQRYVVQLFGSEPDVVAEGASIVEAMCGDALFGIDINMGCPAPKIFRNGEGSALMADLPRAAQIVRAVKDAVLVPVSVKMRSGVRNDEINAVEFAKAMEDAGADRICIHPRTRDMYYSGEADWEILRQVKQAVGVPVIGNGDVNSVEDGCRMRQQTGCDSIMIARGAIGNPFLFEQLAAYKEGREAVALSNARRLDVLLEQLNLSVRLKGEVRATREIKTQIPKYLKGMRGACEARAAIMGVSSLQQMKDALLQFRQTQEEITDRAN